MTLIADKIKRAYSNHPWLPFHSEIQKLVRRLRARRNEFETRFKGIRSTPPFACNPAAATQVHVLTCHKHLSMFLLSVKSLLRFDPDVAVVLHDDGSLTPKDIRTLQHHVEGIHIIRRVEADPVAARAMVDCPRSRAYRAQVINSLELTDHILLGKGEKLIITNSDTLFLRKPDVLLQWIDTPAHDVLCVHESEPYQQAEYLARVGSDFPPHVTLGLVCFPRFEFDAKEVEMLLAQADSSFDPWYLGQNTLPALLGRRVAHERIRFLDSNAYQASGVFGREPVYRHYWSSLGLLNDQFFADGANVIAELRSAGRTSRQDLTFAEWRRRKPQ